MLCVCAQWFTCQSVHICHAYHTVDQQEQEIHLQPMKKPSHHLLKGQVSRQQIRSDSALGQHSLC